MSETAKVPEFEGWAVVELMGHRKLAGYCREVGAFGTAMLRVDVYGDGDVDAQATQYYGGGSLYAVTPCSEQIARSMTKRIRETPEAIAYALPQPKRCDDSWQFATACSPDIVDDAELGHTICGRHKLEREREQSLGHEEEIERGEAVGFRRGPGHGIDDDDLSDPRD